MPTISVSDQGASGYLQVAISSTTSDTGPASLSRRRAGETEWVRIATGLALGEDYSDYTARDGQAYDYQANDPGGGNSNIATGTINIERVWLHVLGDTTTAHQFQYDGGGRSHAQAPVVELVQDLEDSAPTASVGPMVEREVANTLWLSAADRTALDTIMRRRKQVCYRDGRGTKVIGVLSPLTFKGTNDGGYEVALRVVASSGMNEAV